MVIASGVALRASAGRARSGSCSGWSSSSTLPSSLFVRRICFRRRVILLLFRVIIRLRLFAF